MQPLKGPALEFDRCGLACFTLHPLHDEFPGCRHHVQAHHQSLCGRLPHHGVKEPPVDVRRRVLHGKTRVSISVRFNAADHDRRYISSQPLAIRFSTSASCRSECDSLAHSSLERMRSSLLTTHSSKSASCSRTRRVNSWSRKSARFRTMKSTLIKVASWIALKLLWCRTASRAASGET